MIKYVHDDFWNIDSILSDSKNKGISLHIYCLLNLTIIRMYFLTLLLFYILSHIVSRAMHVRAHTHLPTRMLMHLARACTHGNTHTRARSSWSWGTLAIICCTRFAPQSWSSFPRISWNKSKQVDGSESSAAHYTNGGQSPQSPDRLTTPRRILTQHPAGCRRRQPLDSCRSRPFLINKSE